MRALRARVAEPGGERRVTRRRCPISRCVPALRRTRRRAMDEAARRRASPRPSRGAAPEAGAETRGAVQRARRSARHDWATSTAERRSARLGASALLGPSVARGGHARAQRRHGDCRAAVAGWRRLVARRRRAEDRELAPRTSIQLSRPRARLERRSEQRRAPCFATSRDGLARRCAVARRFTQAARRHRSAQSLPPRSGPRSAKIRPRVRARRGITSIRGRCAGMVSSADERVGVPPARDGLRHVADGPDAATRISRVRAISMLGPTMAVIDPVGARNDAAMRVRRGSGGASQLAPRRRLHRLANMLAALASAHPRAPLRHRRIAVHLRLSVWHDRLDRPRADAWVLSPASSASQVGGNRGGARWADLVINDCARCTLGGVETRARCRRHRAQRVHRPRRRGRGTPHGRRVAGLVGGARARRSTTVTGGERRRRDVRGSAASSTRRPRARRSRSARPAPP